MSGVDRYICWSYTSYLTYLISLKPSMKPHQRYEACLLYMNESVDHLFQSTEKGGRLNDKNMVCDLIIHVYNTQQYTYQ